ncbi:MAG: hemerythrin domain-containing protein [Terriglobus roseus]|nr:hemerythrin domain-containing protein [Terriglobus roseus]
MADITEAQHSQAREATDQSSACPKPEVKKSIEKEVPAETEAPLPKLSAREFAAYNSMAEHMDYFHDGFRRKWNLMHDACEANKRPNGMSIRAFLAVGLEFCQHLHMHHSIEERHIFPVLARKMPAFRRELELLTQHKQIHAGMEGMQEYLRSCKDGETELRLEELKNRMDVFGPVLWQHLDDEVKQLGAENMRKYWTVDEMRRMPM